MTLNTACSSGGDAVMTAAMIMKSGEADVMVCTGGESIISPIFIASLAQAKALSRRNEDPEHACRPFDIGHDGFVIGEAAAPLSSRPRSTRKRAALKFMQNSRATRTPRTPIT